MKLKCEASCATCYFTGGRRQDFDENDLIYFCQSCKRFYFCDIGLARGGADYLCPVCNVKLRKEEVDKIIIAKGLIPRGTTSKDPHDMYHKVMGSTKKMKKKHKKKQKQAGSLTAYELSQISELIDIEGLTIPLILELAQTNFGIESSKKLKKIKTKRELLTVLTEIDFTILPFLYSSLFQFNSNIEALKLRFAVFCITFPDFKDISLRSRSSSKGNYDIKLIDSSGKNSWVYFTDRDLDLKSLEVLANRAFSMDFRKFPNLVRILIVAPSISYMAKGMINKFQSIFTGMDDTSTEINWRSIPVHLFEEVPRKIEFRKISLVS